MNLFLSEGVFRFAVLSEFLVVWVLVIISLWYFWFMKFCRFYLSPFDEVCHVAVFVHANWVWAGGFCLKFGLVATILIWILIFVTFLRR